MRQSSALGCFFLFSSQTVVEVFAWQMPICRKNSWQYGTKLDCLQFYYKLLRKFDTFFGYYGVEERYKALHAKGGRAYRRRHIFDKTAADKRR